MLSLRNKSFRVGKQRETEERDIIIGCLPAREIGRETKNERRGSLLPNPAETLATQANVSKAQRVK